MKLIKVGARVLNQTPLDWRGNRRHLEEAIDRAREEGRAQFGPADRLTAVADRDILWYE